MVIIDSTHSVTSRLLQPLHHALSICDSSRKCAVVEDIHWLALGVGRCLQSQSSGRGFLQTFSALMPELCPGLQHFFESLKSTRRLRMVTETNQALLAQGRKLLPDRLAAFPSLDGFEIFASDLHFHEHACHDKPNEDGTHVSVGHLYCRNLRNALVSHLSLAQQTKRKSEHDMSTLKRASTAALRQSAPVGVKVLHVYERAGIDFVQWQKWKQGSGIYFLSRAKENLSLQKCGDLPFEREASVNAGILADELVGPATNQHMLRRVTFHDIHSQRTFEYLTNLTDTNVPPGVIAQLYKMRWDIEKSFDEMKNKLGETKAWATSETAKQMQAQFICLTLNLVSLLAHEMKEREGIDNTAEAARKARRTEHALALELAAGLPAPPAWQMAQAPTQHAVKLYRWIAARMWLPVLWCAACDALRTLYDKI